MTVSPRNAVFRSTADVLSSNQYIDSDPQFYGYKNETGCSKSRIA